MKKRESIPERQCSPKQEIYYSLIIIISEDVV